MTIVLDRYWRRWPALKPMVARCPRIFHGYNTVWWTCNRDDLYKKRGVSIPTGPRGEALLELDVKDFLEAAEQNPEQYGKHGLDALAAAFHGHIRVKDGDKAGLPTTVTSWDEVNQLIDVEASKDMPAEQPALAGFPAVPSLAEELRSGRHIVTKSGSQPASADLGPLPTATGISFAEAIARLIEADPHQWSSRPCQTCHSVSGLLGRPFGCEAKKKGN
jgi:hypothetical protein